MRSLQDRISATQLSEARLELARLSAAIPMFSSWRIPELGRITEQYAAILLWLDGLELYHNVGKGCHDMQHEFSCKWVVDGLEVNAGFNKARNEGHVPGQPIEPGYK